MTDKIILCPKCKEEVKKGAKKCKHCGADLRNWFARHPIITLIVGLMIMGNVLGGSLMPSGTNSTTPVKTVETFKKDPIEMCIYAQKEVPPLLKSPSTAKFPNCTNDLNDGRQIYKFSNDTLYVYKGFVDAQNSFGATIREDYYCKIQYQTYPQYAIQCEVSTPSNQNEMKQLLQRIGVPQGEIDKL